MFREKPFGMPHGARAVEPRIDENSEGAGRVRAGRRISRIFGQKGEQKGGVSIEMFDDERHGDYRIAIRENDVGMLRFRYSVRPGTVFAPCLRSKTLSGKRCLNDPLLEEGRDKMSKREQENDKVGNGGQQQAQKRIG